MLDKMKRNIGVIAEPFTYPDTKKKMGYHAAKAGIAIGSRFGIGGIITGGVVDFVLGSITGEILDD